MWPQKKIKSTIILKKHAETLNSDDYQAATSQRM